MKYKIALTSLLLIITITCANARGLSIQKRLALLEQKFKVMKDGQTDVVDLVMQIQTLQDQMAQLKGIIEEQNHQIENLKEKQKLLYVDIDSRLQEIESRKTNVSLPDDELPGNEIVDQDINTPVNNATISSTDVVEVDENYGSPAVINEINTQDLPQNKYDLAFAHLRAGRYVESARGFEDFIQNYPNDELTDDAYYWLGESYYVKRLYPQSLSAFQSLYKKFPNSVKASDALLKIGYCYFEMDDMVKAKENLQNVIDQYPDTSIARLARNRIIQINREQ